MMEAGHPSLYLAMKVRQLGCRLAMLRHNHLERIPVGKSRPTWDSGERMSLQARMFVEV